MKDWKDHDGGECPVEKGTLVDVQHRDGEIYRGVRAETSIEAEDWSHNSSIGDIIRYRVAEPETNDTATVLRQIADEIERVGVERAHEGFEVYDPDNGTWMPMARGAEWADAQCCKVRPRPRTIQIGDHTVPEPLRVAPEYGSVYYVADPTVDISDIMEKITWDNDSRDFSTLKAGMVHLDPESAAQHARALISVSGGEVEE